MAEKATQNETATPEAKASPMWEGTMSSKEPLEGPDGHVHLSADDIKARDKSNA